MKADGGRSENKLGQKEVTFAQDNILELTCAPLGSMSPAGQHLSLPRRHSSARRGRTHPRSVKFQQRHYDDLYEQRHLVYLLVYRRPA